ncbi:MAG: YqgQ family protein [Streptococcaceae bacterium]|nr:YqgQ family protein [Streptococcaceae bacterium]
MESLYDVGQLLKQFGIYIYLGKRLYDIELMDIEVKNLHEAKLIDDDVYKTARLIIRREHRIEMTKKETRFI